MQVNFVITRSLAGLGVFLTAGMALFAYRYLVPGSPAPDFIAANGFITPWLPVHAAAAATALLVAPLQFRSRLRARRPGLHRVLGRVYVTGCLIGGAAGIVLAFGASTGPVSTAGFGLLALLWVAATAQAWRLAMRRNLISHREWMIRSFALTLAAVTLRLYLPVAQWLPVEFDDAYRAISFLCWVPNLVVAEVYLRRRRRGSRGRQCADRRGGRGHLRRRHFSDARPAIVRGDAFEQIAYGRKPPDHEGLRQAGLKATWPRLNVIKVLRGKQRRHLTASEIYKSLRDAGVGLPMGTVYGAVSSLEGAGIIRRISVSRDQRAVYELADSESHDHMICLDTGQIVEFRSERLVEAAREIAEQHGYDVESHTLVMYVRKSGARR